MKQGEISKWLKAISIGVSIMGLLFFFVIVPQLAREYRANNPDIAYLYWPGLCYGWFIAVIYYSALFQFWKISCEIGRDNSFSSENAKAMVNIAKLVALAAMAWFAGMLFLGFIKLLNPGFIILFCGASFGSIAISVMAAALSRLILKAYELKQENELTI